MRLVRYSNDGAVSIGLVQDDMVVDLQAAGCQFRSLSQIAAGGADALQALRRISAGTAPRHALEDVTLHAPLPQPGKYLAIGMNYRKHIAEAAKLGIDTPKKQLWFNKQTSCIVGPYDDVVKPSVSDEVDYEVELGVVIGTPAHRVRAADAPRHIFGYLVANDVSVRDWQRHSPTFTMGKSFDTHGPIGPWIVTADEIEDPHALDLRCYVNGELRQSSNSSQMVANIYEQIEYLSTAFTLRPGDLIASGTPDGVGAAMDPPTFLKVGDVVRCEVDGIGAIENRIVADPAG